MNFEMIFFLLIAAAAVVSSVLMITRPKPMQSVLSLIVTFFCLAVLYLMLNAQFIAIIQILVYAGAIMVLFLFVVMLLNLGDERAATERSGLRKLTAAVAGGVVLAEIIIGLRLPMGLSAGSGAQSPLSVEMGTVEGIGTTLYTRYLFPFEVTSLLLLAAIVGVIVLAKKKFE
jgi:NADH-quinone oxidoreductase subunit J